MGTAGKQARLDDEEHAAGGGVEREHPEVNRVVGDGHGHGGEPDTADGGQCTYGGYRPLVAEPLTALPIPGAAFADRMGADVMVGAETGDVPYLRGRGRWPVTCRSRSCARPATWDTSAVTGGLLGLLRVGQARAVPRRRQLGRPADRGVSAPARRRSH